MTMSHRKSNMVLWLHRRDSRIYSKNRYELPTIRNQENMGDFQGLIVGAVAPILFMLPCINPHVSQIFKVSTHFFHSPFVLVIDCTWLS
jgi:hypothetical protein